MTKKPLLFHSPCPLSILMRTAALTLILTLAACSSDDDDNATVVDDSPSAEMPVTDTGDGVVDGGDTSIDDGTLTSLSIDASAGGFSAAADDPLNRWAYLDLDTGELLDIDDAAADSSLEWEIAFKRVAVRLNGGVSGPADVRGGIADAQLEFYDESGEPDVDTFVAATADSELPAIQRSVDLASIEFLDEREVGAIVGDGEDLEASWWIYDPAAFSVTANPSVRYAARGADGMSYAKIRVTDIQQSERQISIDLELQSSSDTRFATTPVTWVAAIGEAGGTLCYDFDSMSEVDCSDAASTWDLQAEVTPDGRAWNLWTNGGVRGDGGAGASFGPLIEATSSAFPTADDIPVWTEDTTGGVFGEFDWYAYSLQDQNRIWPNYRVYAIDNGERAWKLQILRYYDESGTSGMIGIRYSDIVAVDATL